MNSNWIEVCVTHTKGRHICFPHSYRPEAYSVCPYQCSTNIYGCLIRTCCHGLRVFMYTLSWGRESRRLSWWKQPGDEKAAEWRARSKVEMYPAGQVGVLAGVPSLGTCDYTQSPLHPTWWLRLRRVTGTAWPLGTVERQMAIREGIFYSIVTMTQKDKHLCITVAQ